MPYLNKEDQRAYQRDWSAKRRASFFKDKTCSWCGSKDNLQLDHKNPETKMYSPSQLWGMAESNPNRIAELNKCQVLCKPCHDDKTNGVGGDLHRANLSTSETGVCSKGHALNEVGWKRSVKPSGFVSKQCLYCSYVNRARRRRIEPISLEEHILKRRSGK